MDCIGRVKLGCRVRNNLVAKPPGLDLSCWVAPRLNEVAAAPNGPFAGEPCPCGPLGVGKTFQEGQTKAQGCARRDHAPKHPTQGSGSTHGTLSGTLSSVLSRDGMVALATWTISSSVHVWDLEKPGPSTSL